ncbi:hypothetical protein [Duganella sp.]|uniref:hypothetical protein n=1 Tax=Duganella sp. TaxID=1904440 RepID=UPI0031DB5BFB
MVGKSRRARKTPSSDALLAVADRLVRIEGLAGLTLRPLAEALGVSVTVLGSRAEMLEAICRAAAEQDASLLAAWQQTLDALPGSLSSAMAAQLAEAVLDDLVTRQRALSMLYLELLHAATWDEAAHTALQPWAARRRAFWQGFGQRAGLPPALLDGGWWNGYIISELAYSMVLEADLSYRMLRRLCLQRLFAGGLGAPDQPADAALHAALQRRMHADIDKAASGPEWSARAARACGIRLAAQGVGGLTHRAIAADIGIAPATLSYHYPTQRSLVVAGLESIIAHMLTAVDSASLAELERLRAQDDGKKLDLARAAMAVAVAAARMPELAAHTADMRGRRGGHLAKVLQKYLPDTQGIDALCAQIISMGLTGLTNMEPPGDASERSVAAAFGAAAQWLKRSAYSA